MGRLIRVPPRILEASIEWKGSPVWREVFSLFRTSFEAAELFVTKHLRSRDLALGAGASQSTCTEAVSGERC